MFGKTSFTRLLGSTFTKWEYINNSWGEWVICTNETSFFKKIESKKRYNIDIFDINIYFFCPLTWLNIYKTRVYKQLMMWVSDLYKRDIAFQKNRIEKTLQSRYFRYKHFFARWLGSIFTKWEYINNSWGEWVICTNETLFFKKIESKKRYNLDINIFFARWLGSTFTKWEHIHNSWGERVSEWVSDNHEP
jgi:hypothetical protein